MLRRCLDVPTGAIDHNNAVLGRGGNIDVVDPDAGSGNHLQLFPGFEHRRCDFSFGSNQKCVIFRDDSNQLVLR